MATRKYIHTPQSDQLIREAYARGTDRRKLSAAITDVVRRTTLPRVIVRLRAQKLGVSREFRRMWTPEDLAVIETYAGEWSVKRLAKTLHRSFESVETKIQRLGFSRRVRDGYGPYDLAHVLGVAFETVQKWERLGWINRREGRFTEVSVARFVRFHHDQYDLRRVDQAWFKGLIFPSEVTAKGECLKSGVRLEPMRELASEELSA